MIAFVISIRHPRNTNGSFSRVLALLEDTLRSVCSQTSPAFRVVIVANEPLPLRFDDRRITFSYVDYPAPSPLSQASFGMEALRLDRGCKYLVGIMRARDLGADHVMFVDADDYVSNRLAVLSERAPAADGWFLREGYVYDRGTGEFGVLDDFHLRCGTSHIVATSLFDIPAGLPPDAPRERILAELPEDYLLHFLGSHRWIVERLAARGRTLEPLPFPAAIYHVGHGENHTARSGHLPLRPRELTAALRDEFGLTEEAMP